MRTKSTLLTLAAILVIGVSPVLAANGHLVRLGGHLSNSERQLIVTYKIAGLGNGQVDEVAVDGSYSISFICYNPSSNKYKTDNGRPFISPRTGEIGRSVATGGEYGMVEGSFALNLAPAVCPGNWVATDVNYEFQWARGHHSAGDDSMDLVWE